MSKKKWFILAAVGLALGLVVVNAVLALALGFFAGHQEAVVDGSSLPVFTTDQTVSAHAGYRRTTLTSGSDVYVNDYEEAALQLMNSDPKPVIGRMAFGDGKVCGIAGQPVTAYVAGDVGSEMPAYEVFRNTNQPPFDWRTATFREMNFLQADGRGNYLQTTNPALLAEVVHILRDGAPVSLPGFALNSITNFSTIKLSSDQLPGLLFCPTVCTDMHGQIYLAESLMMDTTSTPPQFHARWIPASPMLAEWLNAP